MWLGQGCRALSKSHDMYFTKCVFILEQHSTFTAQWFHIIVQCNLWNGFLFSKYHVGLIIIDT